MKTDNWKKTTIIAGVVLGALTGVLGALIVIQRAEKLNTRPNVSAGDGVKLGLGMLGLLRLVSDIADTK